jgi:hypothetical protein
MGRTRTRVFAALLSAAMVIVAAGCGSASKTSTAPNTPEQLKADKAIAKQAVLKPSDLPGYKATPHRHDPSNDTPQPILRKFATCAKIPESKIADLLNGNTDPSAPSVDSPDLTLDESDAGVSYTFENTVEIDRSSKDISEPFDLLGGTAVLPCWKDLFKAAFDAQAAAPGMSVSGLSVTPIEIGPVGDQSAAFEVRVRFTKGARSVNAFLDLYFVRSGRAGISLSASGLGKSVDQSVSLFLVKAVAGRLKGMT